MPAKISITAITGTTAEFAVTDLAAQGTVEVQISSSPDFEFCPSPVWPGFARATPLTLAGLNQSATYWARSRDRLTANTTSAWSEAVKFTTPAVQAPNTAPAAIMIEPALLVVPEPIRAHQLVGYPPPIAGFPVSNLMSDSPTAMRMIGVDNPFYQAFAWDQGPGTTIDTIAILNTNLPEDATIVLRTSDTPGVNQADINANYTARFGPIPFRASANLPGRPGYHGLFRFPPVTARYGAVWIYSGLKVLHAEHLIVGRARTSKNISIDKRESPVSRTQLERRRSGTPDRLTAYPMRKVDFDISAMSETQYETLYGDLWRYDQKPVLVVPNSKSGAFLHDRILYGDLSGGQVVMQNSNLYTRSFSIESLI